MKFLALFLAVSLSSAPAFAGPMKDLLDMDLDDPECGRLCVAAKQLDKAIEAEKLVDCKNAKSETQGPNEFLVVTCKTPLGETKHLSRFVM